MTHRTDHALTALPTWILLCATLAVTLLVPTPGARPIGADHDYAAERRAIIKAEVAREAAGRPCGRAVRITATFPQTALVSPVVGGLEAASVESMPFDLAEREAQAGRVTIRCAII